MAASLLKDGFPSAHLTTRQRIESSLDLHRLFFAIDSDPALIGAGVVYIDEQFNVVTLREFQPICSVVPKKVVLREAPRYVGPSEFKRMLAHEPRESKRMAEALNTAVTCTGAILSWVVISSGIALMPFTAGTSAVITFIGKAATAASSVLKGLTRQERVKLNDELLKIRDPRLTSKLLKLKQASGAATKRISATQMQQATTNHIRDALAATLGFTSSAVSGNVKTLAIGIYEEVSQ
eukprot:gene3551-5516_t